MQVEITKSEVRLEVTATDAELVQLREVLEEYIKRHGIDDEEDEEFEEDNVSARVRVCRELSKSIKSGLGYDLEPLGISRKVAVSKRY